MEESVKKIGEIDLDRMIKTCEQEGWLNPIYVHDDSPKVNQNEPIPDMMMEISRDGEIHYHSWEMDVRGLFHDVGTFSRDHLARGGRFPFFLRV